MIKGDGFMHERFMFPIALLLGFIITLFVCIYFQSDGYIQLCPPDAVDSYASQIFNF